MTTNRAALHAFATALPVGYPITLPRDWVLDLLDGAEVPSVTSPDLTVEEVAKRFGRAPSTVRSWILAGHVRAYRFRGRELRIPHASLDAFETDQRPANTPSITPLRPPRTAVGLAAYRKTS
jgi:excisionase family DNA binding protein